MTAPLVTVIMPVRNEAAFIHRALGAVLAQDYAPLEVLVVDGGSTDDTISIVKSIAKTDPRTRLLHNNGTIQARALNVGIEHARGDVIVRVDGHALIAPDYVRRCVHHLQTTGADNVGGPQRCVGITPTGRAIAAAYRSPFGVPSQFTTSEKAGYVDTVYMGAWPREVFERVGHFNPDLAINEDYEHNVRIRRAGGRVYLAPDIRAEYYGRQSFAALARQYFRYGQGKARMLAQHPGSIRARHMAAPAFVAGLAGGALLAPFVKPVRVLWGGLLLAYALANGIASLAAARHAGRATWRLPGVFATIHLAWGSGFWHGVLRYARHGVFRPQIPSSQKS